MGFRRMIIKSEGLALLFHTDIHQRDVSVRKREKSEMAVRMVVFQIILLLGSMNAFVKAVGLVNGQDGTRIQT